MQKVSKVVDSCMRLYVDDIMHEMLSKCTFRSGQHYNINFVERSLIEYPEVLFHIISKFQRADGQYYYKGKLTAPEAIRKNIINDGWYMLELTCKEVGTKNATYTVLETP